MRLRLVAVLVVIGLVAGVVWWLNGPGSAPGGAACPAADRFEVSDGPVAFEPTVLWRPAELPAVATDPDEQVMLSVGPRGFNWIAFGTSTRGADSHGFALTMDQLEWRADPADAERFAGAEIRLLTEADGRVVAVGSVLADRLATDAWVLHGDEWQIARGLGQESSPAALGVGSGGLLLLGTDPDGYPLAWRSPDGAEWEALDLAFPVDPGVAQLSDVQADGTGWLAVGTASRGADRPSRPLAWASADGGTWTCRSLDNAGFDVVTPTTLRRSAEGWLAIGIASDGCGFGAACAGQLIAWTSPDGVIWSAAQTGIEPWSLGSVAVAGSSEGFVAVSHGVTWWSADGNGWIQLDDGGSGRAALIAQADALAMVGGRLVAVGTTYFGGDADAWIATGVLSR